MVRAGALLALLLAATGCLRMAPDCGRPGPGSVAALDCRAASGDKAAALELGKRYEQGLGVRRDFRRAAALYRQAAAFASGTTYVYSPPVGKHGRGMVLPVRTGVDRPGLAEAKYRLGLMYLEGRGVRFDFRKGLKWVEAAAAGGSPEAAEKLEAIAGGPRT